MSNRELKKGYKQTDVGIIPEDWKVNLIEEISEVKSGKRLPLGKTLIDKTTSHPYIRVADMFWGGVALEDLKFVPDDVFPSIKNYRIYKEDIFISVAGTLGLVGKIPEELDGANLTENADKLTNIKCNRDFLLYLLMSPLIQNAIESARTLGAQPKLALVRIRNFQIPVAPLPEQQAIAEVLSDVDALVTSLNQLITKKLNIKQGAMQLLLTGKKRLTGFSGEWETKTLGEIATFINGRAYHISEWENSGVPVIRLQNLTGGNEYYYSNLKLPPKQYCNYGDLLFMWSATFGVHIWKAQKAIYHYHIWKIECKPNFIEKDFLYFKLNELTQELKQTSTNGGTMLHVTKETMEATEISLPPTIEEQKSITQILSDMDAEIEALETKRDKYKAVKQGMMQELLTGKIRLI